MADSGGIRWCAVSHAERGKCDAWNILGSVDGAAAIECQTAPTVEECVKKIMVNLPFHFYWHRIIICPLVSLNGIPR